MKKRQKKMLNCVPDEPDPEFVGMTRDLAHHLVQKYGNEVFRIGLRRFAILALTEIGCTPEEIADTWRLSIRTVRRHQSWINRNLSLTVAARRRTPSRPRDWPRRKGHRQRRKRSLPSISRMRPRPRKRQSRYGLSA